MQREVKATVEYFQSAVGAEEYEYLQQQMNSGGSSLKLKDDVVTKWSYTFEMFQRIALLQEPLKAVLRILHHPVETSLLRNGIFSEKVRLL